MALSHPVARTVTTLHSLAGHLPPFFTNNLARRERCWIVDWDISAFQEASLRDPRFHREREGI